MVASRKTFFFLVIIFFFLTITTHFVIADQPIIKDSSIEELKYSQEISIPIDTSTPQAKYQPIDIRLEFDHNCWAKNETVHSVRIGYDDGSDLVEIESQIYDLSFSGSDTIDACSCVFLIPLEATSEETYYVYYSDIQTDKPSYPDHISVKDTHYFYEPISGQLIDFDYYQIKEDEYITYGICQKGELLGNGMSNVIIKLLPESTEFKTKNAEQLASFYMSYSTDPSGTYTGSQWAEDIEKTILIDGNLMVRMQIQGISPKGAIKTNNIYTYYYCPTDTKNLHVNVNHDVLDTVEIRGSQQRDGTYCSLTTIKARSGTIEDMNIGEILPDVHLYGEDETIRMYEIPTDPDADPAEWLLSSDDDEDLGSKAWFCIDDPATGIAHGLIFDRNTGILEGPDDGIQIKSSVHQHVKLPGLEADSGDVYAMRNAYEDDKHDTTLPKDLHVSFNVEYIAVQEGGFEMVDSESEIFQTLIKDRPITIGNETSEKPEEEQRYSLTAYVQFAPSAPLGSLLSAGTGRNISYLTAELYRQNALLSSGAAQRLQLGDVNVDFEGKSFSEKIQAVRGMFDLRNSSLLKKVRFRDVTEGTYLVKVYKENPIIGNERKYIGFSVVEVNEDTKIHIYCKTQSTVELTVEDENQDSIEQVYCMIKYNDMIIADGYTNDQGYLSLSIPLYTNKQYEIEGIYDGFEISNESLNLGFLNRWRPNQQQISVTLHDLTVEVTDTLGLPPAIDPNVLVTSTKMINQQNIQPLLIEPGTFFFSSLYASDYQLKMSYKSFELDESIQLNKDTIKKYEFPAEFKVQIDLFDADGFPLSDGTYSILREGKGINNKEISDAKIIATIPPGLYTLDVSNNDNKIASQDINVKGEKSLEVITNQPSTIHSIGPLLILFIGIIGFFICLWKNKKYVGLHLLILFIILFSILQPWWLLSGDANDIKTESKTLLYPANIITITTYNSIIGGEISEVPEEFTTVLHIIMYIIIIAAVGMLLSGLLADKYPRISSLTMILTIVFLILSMILFYVAMTEVTKVGIGNFSGSGEVSLTIPGQDIQKNLECSWGASTGFYTIIVSLIGSLFLLMRKKIMPIIKTKLM